MLGTHRSASATKIQRIQNLFFNDVNYMVVTGSLIDQLHFLWKLSCTSYGS
uniref:Uncharacterized protein n=1 Tax=Arion vulgaris TaxID=1028688 RepID=A0A0B6ZVK1_9EUPU